MCFDASSSIGEIEGEITSPTSTRGQVHLLLDFGLGNELVESGPGDFDAMLMPEMNGLEATHRVRQRYPGGVPHIIAMTANAMEGDRQSCLDAGMDDYLAKPIRVEELVAALGKAPSPSQQ